MTRMRVLAIRSMLALVGLSIATTAFARGGGMGHVGGGGMGHMGGTGRMGHIGGIGQIGAAGNWNGVSHWNGMGWHDRVGHFRPFGGHRRFFAFGFGPYFGYPYYADNGYDDCWQWRHVPTRWGWRRRPVNVCYGSYD